MKNLLIAIVLLLLVVCLGQGAAAPAAAGGGAAGAGGGAPYDLPEGLYSEITTESGVYVCELFYKKTPMTVASYVGLTEGTLGPRKGTNYYDGLKWFRVEANFVIQGGDGAQGGSGGRLGYSFPDEIVPGLRHDGIGTMQMANGGPDTNGSQYCFMLSDQTGLNYNHTVFGHVVRGIEVLPKIKVGDTMKVKILRIGEEAKAFKADEETFKALVDKAKKYNGPRMPGPEAFLDDPDNLVGAAGRGSTFLQFKLANVERFTGVRIMARMFAKTPEEAQGEKLEGYLTALAEKLKVNDAAAGGALVVYFQDQDKWIVRVAKASEASFIAGPRKADGTKDPVAAGWDMDKAMAEYMALVIRPGRGGAGRGRGAGGATQAATQNVAASAPATAQSATASAPATTGRGRGRGRGGAPGAPGVAQRLSVVLDNLIFRLEPAAAVK